MLVAIVFFPVVPCFLNSFSPCSCIIGPSGLSQRLRQLRQQGISFPPRSPALRRRPFCLRAQGPRCPYRSPSGRAVASRHNRGKVRLGFGRRVVWPRKPPRVGATAKTPLAKRSWRTASNYIKPMLSGSSGPRRNGTFPRTPIQKPWHATLTWSAKVFPFRRPVAPLKTNCVEPLRSPFSTGRNGDPRIKGSGPNRQGNRTDPKVVYRPIDLSQPAPFKTARLPFPRSWPRAPSRDPDPGRKRERRRGFPRLQ